MPRKVPTKSALTFKAIKLSSPLDNRKDVIRKKRAEFVQRVRSSIKNNSSVALVPQQSPQSLLPSEAQSGSDPIAMEEKKEEEEVVVVDEPPATPPFVTIPAPTNGLDAIAKRPNPSPREIPAEYNSGLSSLRHLTNTTSHVKYMVIKQGSPCNNTKHLGCIVNLRGMAIEWVYKHDVGLAFRAGPRSGAEWLQGAKDSIIHPYVFGWSKACAADDNVQLVDEIREAFIQHNHNSGKITVAEFTSALLKLRSVVDIIKIDYVCLEEFEEGAYNKFAPDVGYTITIGYRLNCSILGIDFSQIDLKAVLYRSSTTIGKTFMYGV
jgi:hypothetical protein